MEQIPARRRLSGRQVVAGLIALVLVVLVLQNTNRTRVDVFFVHATLPLWLVVAGVALLGFAVGWLTGRRRR